MQEELHLTAKDFKVEWFSGKGAGGQHRNKHQNCCRITYHGPDGKVYTETGQRSKHRSTNRSSAFQRIAVRIIEDHTRAGTQAKRQANPNGNTIIRTYNFAENRIKNKGSKKSFPADIESVDNVLNIMHDRRSLVMPDGVIGST